jgi:hypothetical protein
VHSTLAGVSCLLGSLAREDHFPAATAADSRRMKGFCCCNCRGKAICCICEDCTHVLQQA